MKGLTNIGNTCYLNAALQMLLLNSDFCNLILSYNGGMSDILNEISKLIINYYTSNLESISPEIIKNIIKKKYKMFDGYQQHDSYEFICCFFDIINDEINKINNTNEKYNLYNIFGFELKSRIKCKLLNCLYSSKKSDEELMLHLTVEKTLEESFNNFKSRELMINEYRCDKCQIKSVASKRLNIFNYSNNLLICLKRFNCINEACNKISDHIEIPLELPLELPQELSLNNYKLQGAIIHSGSYSGGHYIYIGIINGIWYMFNDNYVTELKSNLRKELLNAYCLHYKLI